MKIRCIFEKYLILLRSQLLTYLAYILKLIPKPIYTVWAVPGATHKDAISSTSSVIQGSILGFQFKKNQISIAGPITKSH